MPLCPPPPERPLSPRRTGERSRPFSPAPALPLHQAPFPSRRNPVFWRVAGKKRRSVSPEFAHSNDRLGPGLARRELSGHTQSASWEGRPPPPPRCPRGRAGQAPPARRSPAAKAAYIPPSAERPQPGRGTRWAAKAALTRWEPPRTLSRRMSAVPTRPPFVRAWPRLLGVPSAGCLLDRLKDPSRAASTRHPPAARHAAAVAKDCFSGSRSAF